MKALRKAIRVWWAHRRLNSKRPKRICKGAKTLGALKREKAVFPLASRLKHGDPTVRAAVATALGKIGSDEAIVPLVLALGDEDEEAGLAVNEALVSFGKKAVPHLIATTNSDNDALRVGAAHALGLVKDPAAVQALLEKLADASPDVRSAAAKSLGRANDERAVMPLLMCLQDHQKICRVAAEEALVRYGALASPQLIQVVRGMHRTSRISAMKVLGAMKDYGATDALADALNDSSPEIRRGALVALGKIGDTSVVPRLRKHLNGDDREFRAQAFDALEDLSRTAVADRDWKGAVDCGDGAVRPTIEAVFGQLQEVQEDNSKDLIALDWVPDALQALVKIGDIKAILFLFKLLAEPELSDVALATLEDWLRNIPVDFSEDQLRELAALEQVVAINRRDGEDKICDCFAVNDLARNELRKRADPEYGKPREPEPPSTPQEDVAPPPLPTAELRIRLDDDSHVNLPPDAQACSLCSRSTYARGDSNVRLFVSDNRVEDRAFVRNVRKTFWLMEELSCPECDRHFCWDCAVKHVHESGITSPGEGREWCPGCAAKMTVESEHRPRSQFVLSPEQVATTVDLLLELQGSGSPDVVAFSVGNRLVAAGWHGVDAYFGRLYANDAAKMIAEGRATAEELRDKVKC
jgi:HEAT repeat protein